MLIAFSTIDFDVQVMISKKLDFRTSIRLQLSSKIGHSVAASTSQFTVLDVNKVHCDQDVIRLYFENPLNGKKSNKRWSDIRKYSNLPMFCIHHMRKYPNVCCNALNNFLEEANFAKKKSELCWSTQKTGEVELFLKIVEKINVVTFHPGYKENENYTLVSLPQFIQMECVSFPFDRVPDDLYLAVQAHTTSCVTLQSHPNSSLTINRFLKQWLSKEREIRSACVILDQSTLMEDLCYDLPVTVICSNRNCSVAEWGVKDIYLLSRGDRQLQLSRTYYNLRIEEIQNVYEFEKNISSQISKGFMERRSHDEIVPVRKDSPSQTVKKRDNCSIS